MAGDDRYVLRIAGDGTEEFIDRKAEEQCARVAADAGVNAGVIFFDPSDGLMLCRLIDDSVTMDGEKFKDLGAVARAARAFRAIHTCANPAEDFWAYATGRLARCRALMDSPGFASHLDAVRR